MNTHSFSDKSFNQQEPSAAEAPAAGASGRAQAKDGLPDSLSQEPSLGRSLCNTAPQSIQQPLIHFPDYLFSGGLDWLEWSVSVEWEPTAFEQLFAKLRQVKDKCQAESLAEERVWLARKVPAYVRRMGKSRGGGRGRHYPFCLVVGGIVLALGDWQATTGIDNLFVRLTGRDCLLHGAWESYHFVCDTILALGGKIIDEKLSRVDFCLDIAALKVSELQELVEQRHFITRLKEVRPQVNLVGDVQTGFTAGKCPQRLIAYDKLAQSLPKYDQEYVQALIQRRYGGNIPEQATRIEVQLSREFLLKSGISTPGDIAVNAPFALRQFLTETFRLTDRAIPHGSKNHSRASIHPLWGALIQGFETVFGSPQEPPLILDRSQVNPNQLLKQSLGCLRNAMLQKGLQVTSYQEFLELAAWELENLLPTLPEQREFVEDYQFRLKEHVR